jgi:hypothetical protein
MEQYGRAASSDAKLAFVAVLESSLTLSRVDQVDELLGRIEAMRPGQRPPFLRAQAARFRARLAGARGLSHEVEPGFKTAAAILREYGLPFHRAITQLEYGEWLVSESRTDEATPRIAEARAEFERLEAMPWIECSAQAIETGREPEAVTGRA